MNEEASGDKEYEATQKRLEQARAKGEIPKSLDLNAAAGFAGLTLAILVAGTPSVVAFGNAFGTVLGQADRLAPLIIQNPSSPMGGLALAFLTASLPFFVAPILAVLGALWLQRAIKFSPEKLAFKLERISPIQTAAQKFGLAGIAEFAKNATKMLVFGLLLGVFLTLRVDNVLASLYLGAANSMVLFFALFLEFMFLVLLISAVFGGFDYLWQLHQHAQKNRMSRKEMMDEMKESEGDPHVKQTRRQKGQEIATNRMLADVPTADVIIVNPTHFAVALKWSRRKGSAPICVAKGVDEVAARIRKLAQEAQVPIHSDPPTARILYASVDLGAQIQPEHYRAVAAAIRFSERMRKLARLRSGSAGAKI